jgi:hypothetical protein
VDDLIKVQPSLGLWSSGDKALCHGSEDGRCPQPVPPVEVDDVLSATSVDVSSAAITALVELTENLFNSRVDAVGLDNLQESMYVVQGLQYP